MVLMPPPIASAPSHRWPGRQLPWLANPSTTPDATTAVADPSSAAEPSILRDLAPRAVGGTGAGSRQLAANYRAILAARAIHYPVAYRFPRELGRGRQGIVFLGLRQGARGCVTRHAIKLFDPSI